MIMNDTIAPTMPEEVVITNEGTSEEEAENVEVTPASEEELEDFEKEEETSNGE